jgi:riboflavin-specific deaminase-like protein
MIATRSGDSRYINGPDALDHLHRLRAAVDAVIIGARTAIADDPLLTVRRVEGRDPARVVIDPAGRLGPRARCLRADGVRRVVVRGPSGGRAHAFDGGVEIVVCPFADGAIPARAIIEALSARGMHRLLVEGGGNTVSRFIVSGCVDRLHLMVAPLFLGGGRPGLDLRPSVAPEAAARLPSVLHRFDDGDVLLDCDLAPLRGTKEAEHESRGEYADARHRDLFTGGEMAALDDGGPDPRHDPGRHRDGEA